MEWENDMVLGYHQPRVPAGSLTSVAELDDFLTRPSAALVEDLASLDGDIMVIGSAGKMGPTLSVLAARALAESGSTRKVIAVSRFADAAARDRLDAAGIRTIPADLSDPDALAALPDAPNIVYMLGTKFGTTGREYQTWATNVYLSGRVAERFRASRFTVFSSGNIYPLRPVVLGGADESVVPAPVGEYAQTCLGRERVFENASHAYGTRVSLFRLNYAIDLRYGVLFDIATQVHDGQAVDVSMGSVNVIWQGDANAIALRALTVAESPPTILNVTGPETASVRWLVHEFAKRFNVEPKISGEEAASSLLSNPAKAFGLFGYPSMPLASMIDLVAGWIEAGGPSLGKPTHFQEREGRF
jgi:nucleoside-diphosphate-sugar epimerase